jgi:hypothetical protein
VSADQPPFGFSSSPSFFSSLPAAPLFAGSAFFAGSGFFAGSFALVCVAFLPGWSSSPAGGFCAGSGLPSGFASCAVAHSARSVVSAMVAITAVSFFTCSSVECASLEAAAILRSSAGRCKRCPGPDAETTRPPDSGRGPAETKAAGT